MSAHFCGRDLAWAKHWGMITASGVHYGDELAGPEGVVIILYSEPGTTPAALLNAIRQLEQERDVVRYVIAEPRVAEVAFINDHGHDAQEANRLAGLALAREREGADNVEVGDPDYHWKRGDASSSASDFACWQMEKDHLDSGES